MSLFAVLFLWRNSEMYKLIYMHQPKSDQKTVIYTYKSHMLKG